MKKIFTLMMFAVLTLSASAHDGAACFGTWYDTYGYFTQQWSNEGDVYTLPNFLNSGYNLVVTATGEGTTIETGGTQYAVTLSAPESQSYETGGYFYFCDKDGYFAGLYPGESTDYLVMCAYTSYCVLVKDDPTYGSYISLGAYWDTDYSAWDYIYIYLYEDDSINAVSAQSTPALKTLNNGRIVIRRGNALYNVNGSRIK